MNKEKNRRILLFMMITMPDFHRNKPFVTVFVEFIILRIFPNYFPEYIIMLLLVRLCVCRVCMKNLVEYIPKSQLIHRQLLMFSLLPGNVV